MYLIFKTINLCGVTPSACEIEQSGVRRSSLSLSLSLCDGLNAYFPFAFARVTKVEDIYAFAIYRSRRSLHGDVAHTVEGIQTIWHFMAVRFLQRRFAAL